MFLYYAQVDTWAKEAVEPTDQRVGIKRAADKANGATHANGAMGVQCKYGAAGLWCKYGTEGLYPLLASDVYYATFFLYTLLGLQVHRFVGQ